MRRAIWAVGALMVLAVGMFLFGFPTRTYLDQRASLAQEQATVTRLAADNQSLRAQDSQLQTTSDIARIARQQYGLVQPGQEEYAILPVPARSPAPVPARSPAPSRRATAPATAPATATATAPATPPAGLWSRFVQQLKFWD